MVADLDKGGEKEDEYFSEVTSEEHIEGEESFKFNDPLANVEIEDAEVAPQKSSAMKKVGMVIVIVIVGLIVSMYLTHKQKMKEAAQLGKTTTPAATTSQGPSDLKTDVKPADTSAASNSTAMKASVTTEAASASSTPAVSVPTADNASLAAAISKGVSPVTPAKSDANLAGAISKDPNPPVATKAPEKPAIPAAKSEPVKITVKPTENAVGIPAEAPTKELPAKVTEPAATAVSSENPKIMGRIDDLNLQTQANQTKISELSTRLDSIDKSMSEINKTLATLERKSSVSQVAVAKEASVTPTPPVFKKAEKAAPASTSQKMNIAAEHSGKSHHKNHRRMPQQQQAVQQQSSQQQTMMTEQHRNSVPYVLKAIIPGRAWIERPLAGVTSVMEGDYVPGAGKIVSIDADNGELTLDTGDVIKYGMDDH